jgi:GTP-binding protein HflX
LKAKAKARTRLNQKTRSQPRPVEGGRSRAAIVHPYGTRGQDVGAGRGVEQALAEAVGLARAIDLDLAFAEAAKVPAVHPKTYLGSGKVAELAAAVASDDVDLVVINGPLNAGQQRNLEKALGCKTIDRSGLILEIFGARARTREGALQVERAALEYQRGRLVRSWTHLERQRGGFGFLGGPGETQIEADRRHISARIKRIEKSLATITRTRGLHRDARARVPYPVVATVGYTNAGKSTLLNRLTDATVLTEDMLFATLDPTMRGVTLPSGRTIILSDTVGFISGLPAQLVAAFRATLEEVVHADLILHVRDFAHPDSGVQREDVIRILADLCPEDQDPPPVMEVLNKIDLLDDDARAFAANSAQDLDDHIAFSALTGEGTDALLAAIDLELSKTRTVVEIDVPLENGAAIAWLYERGEVHDRQDQDAMARIKVGLDAADLGRFRKRLLAAE